MAAFPSVEWFNTVREIFNADERFRGGGGGMCNATVGFKIGERSFLVTFEGFECTEANEVRDEGFEAADFYLEMSPSDWQTMIQNIKGNGHADLHHTLNTLDLGREGGISHSAHGDQYREDLFFRYNQTFQYFFDASARINTRFDTPIDKRGGQVTVADPTLGWLEKARQLCNQDTEFHRLGTCDARVGIKAGDVAFLVTFEAFECVAVQEIGVDELRDADFYIDMPRSTWRAFLTGRRNGNGGSLISYGVDSPGGIVRAESPLNHLKFDRYHRTLQHFLDKVAALVSPAPA